MALKSREKILLFGVVIALAIGAFDWFYYTPQEKRILRHREEIKALDLQLKELLIYGQGMESVEGEVSRLEKEMQGHKERMLRGAEFQAFLRYLAQQSDRFQIKMISLTPEEEKASLPQKEKRTPAFEYRRVTVHMVVRSTYGALNAYLRALEELPFLTVDHLRVEQSEKTLPFLQASMGVSVQVISP